MTLEQTAKKLNQILSEKYDPQLYSLGLGDNIIYLYLHKPIPRIKLGLDLSWMPPEFKLETKYVGKIRPANF